MFLLSMDITRTLTKSFEHRETSQVSVIFPSKLILAAVGSLASVTFTQLFRLDCVITVMRTNICLLYKFRFLQQICIALHKYYEL